MIHEGPALTELLSILSAEIEEARRDQQGIQGDLDGIIESAPNGLPLSDRERAIVIAGVATQRAFNEFEAAVCRFRTFAARIQNPFFLSQNSSARHHPPHLDNQTSAE